MPKEKTYPEGLKRVSVNITIDQSVAIEAYIIEQAQAGKIVTMTDIVRLALEKFLQLETTTPAN